MPLGAAGGPPLEQLSQEAARRQALKRERAALDALDSTAALASAAVRRALLRQAGRIREALLEHREEAREVLPTFVDRITFTPYGTGRARGYTFGATGSYGSLFGETVPGVPDGIGSAWTQEFRGVLAA